MSHCRSYCRTYCRSYCRNVCAQLVLVAFVALPFVVLPFGSVAFAAESHDAESHDTESHDTESHDQGSHDQGSHSGYEAKVEAFFATLEEGEAARALATLYGEDNIRLESQPDELPTMQQHFETILAALGEMHGRQLVAEELVTDRFVLLWYVAFFDHAPFSFYFKFYKANDEWRFYTVEFKNDLGKIAEERVHQSTEPATRD